MLTFKPLRVNLVQKDMVHIGKEGLERFIRHTWLPYLERFPEDPQPDFVSEVSSEYISHYPFARRGWCTFGWCVLSSSRKTSPRIRIIKMTTEALADLQESRMRNGPILNLEFDMFCGFTFQDYNLRKSSQKISAGPKLSRYLAAGMEAAGIGLEKN